MLFRSPDTSSTMTCHQRTASLQKQLPELSLLMPAADKGLHVVSVPEIRDLNGHQCHNMTIWCPSDCFAFWHQIDMLSIIERQKRLVECLAGSSSESLTHHCDRAKPALSHEPLTSAPAHPPGTNKPAVGTTSDDNPRQLPLTARQ